MKKWALALEGGSLRCMFSAGAVDVMMEQGLWSDGVFGVSAGALTGVNYVSRQVGRTAQVNLDYVNDKRYLGLGNLICGGGGHPLRGRGRLLVHPLCPRLGGRL